MKKMSRYREGKPITSIDELMKQDFIYFRHKLYHKGWFGSWQLRFAKRYIDKMSYAEKAKPDTIICNNCGRTFTDETDLKKFMQVQIQAGDVVILNYDTDLLNESRVKVFRGCPECRTDAYLVSLEVDE